MKNLFEVKPWDNKSKRKFMQLVKKPHVYTSDIDFTRKLGRNYPDLFDENNGFLDIGRIKKTKRSVIVKRDNVRVRPVFGSSSRYNRLKFEFYKIFE